MTDSMYVNGFSKDYRFLSNFYPSPIVLDGKEWSTVEHYFQAMKSTDEADQEKIRLSIAPNIAKSLGRKVSLREDWDAHKLLVMEKALRAKFKIPELKEKLLATGNLVLIEGNYWEDAYWGVPYEGVGCNHLGNLLMQIRTDIINDEYVSFEEV